MAFRDGLGERRIIRDSAGASVEVLCLRKELAAVPSFEFALRERITRLAGFRHAYYGRVRGSERSTEFDHALTIASDATPGIRLSALLDTAHEQRLPVDLDVALCLIRQLVPAVAILHETARDVAHGALGPERLIVTPNGRLLIVEYVLGSALEQLLFTRERYWTELRVALPRVAGLPRFDHVADVTQIGVTALSLILGRTLADDEYPLRIGEVLATAVATNDLGEKSPLPSGIRSWLQRALQLDARSSFPSAIEARAEFERVLADSGHEASPQSLDAFMKRYHANETHVEPQVPSPVKPAAAPLTLSTPQPSPAVSAPAASTLLPAVVPSVQPLPPVVPRPSAPASTVASSQPVAAAHIPAVVEKKEWLSPATEAKTVASKATSEVDKPTLSEALSVTGGPEGPHYATEPLKVPASRARRGTVKIAASAALGVVVLGAVGLVGARRFWAVTPPPQATGTLVVTTNPAGAEAFVDDVRRGSTPITLELLAGTHRVELRGYGDSRTIPVMIAPGQQVAQYIDLPVAPPPAEPRPEVTAPPPPPAERAITETPASGPGWIAVNGKVEVQLFEDGHLLGTSAIERIMVPAGRHDLEIVNELIGYKGTRSVQVSPGKVTTVSVDLPKGSMAVNALPWAEVWMDGNKIGETPIGNFAVPIGSHDVVFKHPDFGEQRETVLVTLKSPVRLSVDMRKP
jgi:serine/threonine protein kinase